MTTIPVVRTTTPDGDLLSPTQPFPSDSTLIICDGRQYLVYQSGDTLPEN